MFNILILKTFLKVAKDFINSRIEDGKDLCYLGFFPGSRKETNLCREIC